MHGLDTIIKMNGTTDGMSVGDHVKFIVFRESGWFDPNTDQRLWDHLTRAYGDIELQIIEQWDQAVFPEGYTRVLVDGSGDTPIIDYTHPTKAVYIFGRTSLNLYEVVDPTSYDVSLNIPTPVSVPMFGAVAGGIVLHDRFIKSIN